MVLLTRHRDPRCLRPGGIIPAPPEASPPGTNLAADVAVVGGGPVGCVAALAFARAGAKVCLVEANLRGNRLAGEWLHPAGVGVLTQFGVDLDAARVPHARGTGFVIFPHGAADPIHLPYVGGESAIGCEHHLLVGAIREAVARCPAIRMLSGFRAGEVRPGTLSVSAGHRHPPVRVRAGLIVGADGRQSVVRQALGCPSGCRPVSYMAGVLIDPEALPFPGYGHVFLGGPGPVLVFRVGPNRARVCFDVPPDRVGHVRDPDRLLAAFGPALPAAVVSACRRALAVGPPSVAANQWLPRRHYGRGRLALVGDAVGHCHPLCAVGMSVGFQDAVALARSRSVAEYAAARRSPGRVPELLSMGLYDMIVGPDEAAVLLRNAVYHLWRSSPVARRETMRLLAVRETRRGALVVTFARLLAAAVGRVVTGAPRRPIRRTVASLAGLGSWAYWLARESLVD
jgi:2-polyprenyl-6-methoxyphenol hydroxylase-like FAD-dependent oxidoreductase